MESENVLLNIQLPRTARDDFRIAAKREGKSMSALVYRYILLTIRQAKAEAPELFPDYSPPPRIAGGDSEIEQIIYETFEGKDIEPERLRQIMKAIKPLLEIQEITKDQNID